MRGLPVSRLTYRPDWQKLEPSVTKASDTFRKKLRESMVLKFVAPIVILVLFLAGCAPDKQKHFVAGMVVSSWVYAETGDRLEACLASLGVGIAKELIDSNNNGYGDGKDAAATLAGCSVTWVWDLSAY